MALQHLIRDQAGDSLSTILEPRKYPGSGTLDCPYIVDWDKSDPEDPRQWSVRRRWILTIQLGFATWNVSYASSSYTGGLQDTITSLHTSRIAAILGISLYVLGFGVGPVFFAPLSEMYGRRIVFLCTYTPYLFLHLGGALGSNIQTLVICRFLGGIAGSAPISNAAGQIADMWSPRERGLATALYSVCTYFGPVSGPIVGGFISESFPRGWRINFWIMFGLSAATIILAFLNLSETYAPVLLQQRAERLHAESGGKVHYVSIHAGKMRVPKREILRINLTRPIIFLIREPIVTCISVYISVIYAILYAQFTAFPIVFQEHRHFTPGQGGLAFLGIALGQWVGLASTPMWTRLYWRAMKKGDGTAPPEARLYAAITGAVAIPIGMFWFAWTTFPSVPAIVPILAGMPFGMGSFFINTSLNAYLMDAYSLYCASALASAILLRSIFAAAFPIFSPLMFESLGDPWACSVFAFLSLACMPIPILFFKYGSWVRSRSKFAVKTSAKENSADVTVEKTIENKEVAKEV